MASAVGKRAHDDTQLHSLDLEGSHQIPLHNRSVACQVVENLPLRGAEIVGAENRLHRRAASHVAPLRPSTDRAAPDVIRFVRHLTMT